VDFSLLENSLKPKVELRSVAMTSMEPGKLSYAPDTGQDPTEESWKEVRRKGVEFWVRKC